MRTSFPNAVLWLNAGFTETVSHTEFQGIRSAVIQFGDQKWNDASFTGVLTERNKGYLLENKMPRRLKFRQHFQFQTPPGLSEVYVHFYYTMMLANYFEWKDWGCLNRERFSVIRSFRDKSSRQIEATIKKIRDVYYVAITGFPIAYHKEKGGEGKLQDVIRDVQVAAFSIGLSVHVAIKCYCDQADFLTQRGYELLEKETVEEGEYGTYVLPPNVVTSLEKQFASSHPIL